MPSFEDEYGFVATDVANLHAGGFAFARDLPVPEILGFFSVADNIAVDIYLDLVVGVPRPFRVVVVKGDVFYQLQSILGQFYGLEFAFLVILFRLEVELSDSELLYFSN